jgi:hypothetical protein
MAIIFASVAMVATLFILIRGRRENTIIKDGFIFQKILVICIRPLRMHSRQCQSRHREDGRLSMSHRSVYLTYWRMRHEKDRDTESE